MALIKSHSNYVLKKKHQNVSDGTIWERDITTIGRANFFAPGQEPIFRDNNFIITVRNDNTVSNQYNRGGWKDSGNGDVWTLQTISAITSEYDDQNDTKIVLKQDYYDFCDFAYYGSLSELFRASITDIIARFPGELYGSEDHVYYTHVKTVDGERVETEEMIGEDGFINEVKNPFGIDIHTAKLPVGKNPLKYFADNGFKEYTYNGSEITSWSAETENSCAIPGELIATITINGDKVIRAYGGNNGSVHYMHKSLSGCHIRPKESYLSDFYNECDNFQKLLMNKDTTPKYKADFSVIKEDEYGYSREMRTFIFPTSSGGYNIDATSYGFNAYTNDLARIGEFYDERFTDNLWRAMTHEAIKNFDWTYTREYDYGEGEEYTLGGEKMQKALRIFAREFDEVKTYIDNITSVNRITYDDRANIPNYFLTDVCEDDGWDVIQVVPYETTDTAVCAKKNFVQNTKKEVQPYSNKITGKNGTDITNGYFVTCCDGDRADEYLCEYENPTWMERTPYHIVLASGETRLFEECNGKKGRVLNRIKSYVDPKKTYTYMDVNNEFLRRVKLNSRYIWRNKGTEAGIEMILAMFGLKSKREYEKQEACGYKRRNWDFEIKEYTRFTEGIKDIWDTCHSMFNYDWVNSTKTITYDYRTVSAYNTKGAVGINYIPYQGLPASYVTNGYFRTLNVRTDICPEQVVNYIIDRRDDAIKIECNNQSYKISSITGNSFVLGNTTFVIGDTYIEDKNGFRVSVTWDERYLYPNFNKIEQYDGNPYYQMNGGWLSKKIADNSKKYNFQFDVDNVPVYDDVNPIYKETVRNIRKVENLGELVGIPSAQLRENTICYVESLDKDMLIADGEAFEINSDSNNKEFVILRKSGGEIKVGDKHFYNSIEVYGSDYEIYTYTLDDKLDGYPVYAYIKNGTGFHCADGNYSTDLYSFFRRSDESYSNYFILTNPDFSNNIASGDDDDGWRRIKTSEKLYKKINTIWNYYKGNNPHSGGMNYDNGEYYYEYFKHLFKHAYENNLFDERCFNDYYAEIDDIYERAGFSAITSDREDTKVHYFGNYSTAKQVVVTNNGTRIYNNDNGVPFSSTTEAKLYLLKHTEINGYVDTEVGNNYLYSADYSIGSGIRIDREKEPWTSSYSITNQIINNKRFTIVFNIGYDYNTPDGQNKLKFIDEIVMNYLTQIIPSTTIVDVEYKFLSIPNYTCCKD